MNCVWQIMVPCTDNEGRPYRTRYHRVWDEKVKEVSNGLTIHAPSKGKWHDNDGKLFEEYMIPVTFIATKEQATEIAEFTLKYYKQKAVLCYMVSTDYILIEEPKGKTIDMSEFIGTYTPAEATVVAQKMQIKLTNIKKNGSKGESKPEQEAEQSTAAPARVLGTDAGQERLGRH